jgi:hypothetical protein
MVISTSSEDLVSHFAVGSVLDCFKGVSDGGTTWSDHICDSGRSTSVDAVESVTVVIYCLSRSVLGQMEVRPSELFRYCYIRARSRHWTEFFTANVRGRPASLSDG